VEGWANEIVLQKYHTSIQGWDSYTRLTMWDSYTRIIVESFSQVIKQN